MNVTVHGRARHFRTVAFDRKKNAVLLIEQRLLPHKFEIVAIRDWRRSTIFSAADRAVLAAADDTLENGKISDEFWAECVKQLKEPAVLIEMVVAIGNWTMFSQLLQSLGVGLESGAAPWPPDGKAPASA